MVKTPKSKMQQIAAEMVRLAGLDVEYGEYEFVSRATPLLMDIVRECYEEAGLETPSKRTIENWLYKPKAPDLATALVNYCWNQKKLEAPMAKKILI